MTRITTNLSRGVGVADQNAGLLALSSCLKLNVDLKLIMPKK